MRVNHALAAMPAEYLFARVQERVALCQQLDPQNPVLRLGIGDVTLPLGAHIAQAFAQAAAGMGTPEGFRGYAPAEGYPFLKEAIRAHEYAARGVDLDADDIFISSGAKEDAAALERLFGPDARIAVTDPVYPVYADANAMAGRLGAFRGGRWERLHYLPCTGENGFEPPLPEEPVDVIYLCFPNNPTGTALGYAALKRFVDYAREHRALIVFDAAYRAFITDEAVPRSIYQVEGAQEVAIECCSFSKFAGFTGVRCGWTVVPGRLLGRDDSGNTHSVQQLWRRLLHSTRNGVSFSVQRAALAVFDPEGQKECREAVAYYMGNARLLLEEARACGLAAHGGVNAPYVWARTPDGMDSWQFFEFLLERARVAVTPGAGFGPGGEGYFRLSAFNTPDNTRQACRRIRAALR